MFIVEGKRHPPAGAVSVVKKTREDALETAMDFLDQGIPIVTITADGRTYTAVEFALTIITDARGPDGPSQDLQ